MIYVSIQLALICFTSSGTYQCHPALVGPSTPVGEFHLIERRTSQPGYGGDVLQFHEDSESWYAVHRVWTLKPKEHRTQRLQSAKPSDRQVTKGCVNVDPKVYEQLKLCCSNQPIVITK